MMKCLSDRKFKIKSIHFNSMLEARKKNLDIKTLHTHEMLAQINRKPVSSLIRNAFVSYLLIMKLSITVIFHRKRETNNSNRCKFCIELYLFPEKVLKNQFAGDFSWWLGSLKSAVV